MKYALECDVESSIRLTATVELKWDKRHVTLLADDKGLFNKVKIVGEVADPTTCKSWYSHENDHIEVHIVRDDALHEAMLRELQALESGIAFECPLGRFRWHSARYEFLPETEEEQAQIRVPSLQIRPGADHPEPLTDLDVDAFVRGAHIALKCPDLLVPLAFYREGLNALRDFRNIQAFINFYFILEGLYGGGDYEFHKLRRRFAQSKILKASIEYCIHRGFPKPFHEKNQTIERTLKKMAKQSNLEGIIHLLIKSRGEVHHFLDILKTTGTPLNDDQYESLANLSQEIARVSLIEEIRARLSSLTPT